LFTSSTSQLVKLEFAAPGLAAPAHRVGGVSGNIRNLDRKFWTATKFSRRLAAQHLDISHNIPIYLTAIAEWVPN
jgi:hypothetical protein